MNKSDYFDLPRETQDELLSEEALELINTITNYVTVPLALLGFFFNYMVILGWSKCSSSTRHLVTVFRVLAIMDIVYVLAYCIYFGVDNQSLARFVALDFANIGKYIVVNLTLLLCLLRWVTLVYPQKIKAKSEKHLTHTMVAIGIIVAYCATLRVILGIDLAFKLFAPRTRLIVEAVINQIAVVLPVVLQVLMTVHTLSVSRRMSRRSCSVKEMKKSYVDSRNKQLTYIVVTTTAVNAAVYPAAVYMLMAYKLTYERSSYEVVVAVVNLMYITVSTGRIFIYLAFMPEFRTVLKFFLMCRRLPLSPIKNKKGKSTTTAMESAALRAPSVVEDGDSNYAEDNDSVGESRATEKAQTAASLVPTADLKSSAIHTTVDTEGVTDSRPTTSAVESRESSFDDPSFSSADDTSQEASRISRNSRQSNVSSKASSNHSESSSAETTRVDRTSIDDATFSVLESVLDSKASAVVVKQDGEESST